MAARSSWAGSIVFAGFPIPVKAYNLIASPSKEGFKTLCACHGAPIKQENTCATTGKALDAAEQRKGVEVAKDAYRTLDDAAISAINGVGKSVALEVEAICPLDTLPLTTVTGCFRIVADSKAGADKPVAILWAALKKSNMAIVTRWTPRAGSRDAIIAIHPGDSGLLANTLPFEHQLTAAPTDNTASIAVSDAEMAMFEQAMNTLYTVGPYAAKHFVSDHNARRAKAIEAAVAGKPVDVAAVAAAPVVPDLMAALAASLQGAGATPVQSPDKEPITA